MTDLSYILYDAFVSFDEKCDYSHNSLEATSVKLPHILPKPKPLLCGCVYKDLLIIKRMTFRQF